VQLTEQLKSTLVSKAVKNIQRGTKKEEIEGTMFRPEVTLWERGTFVQNVHKNLI